MFCLWCSSNSYSVSSTILYHHSIVMDSAWLANSNKRWHSQACCSKALVLPQTSHRVKLTNKCPRKQVSVLDFVGCAEGDSFLLPGTSTWIHWPVVWSRILWICHEHDSAGASNRWKVMSITTGWRSGAETYLAIRSAVCGEWKELLSTCSMQYQVRKWSVTVDIMTWSVWLWSTSNEEGPPRILIPYLKVGIVQVWKPQH